MGVVQEALILSGLLAAVGLVALSAWIRERRAAQWQRVVSMRLAGGLTVPDEDTEDELEQPYARRVIWPKLAAFRKSLARRITPAHFYAELDAKLRLANMRQSADAFFFSRLAMAFVGLLVGGLVATLARTLSLDLRVLLPIVIAGALYLYPGVHLNTKLQERLEDIDRGLPEVFDLLSVSVEAGLAFDGALKTVATNAEGAARDEFSRVLADMQLGIPRAEALSALAERTRSMPLKRFAGLVAQSDRSGSGIGNALRIQARDIKRYRAAKAREKAASLPIKILFPMIIFIFPAMFVIILGPAVISVMKVFHI